MAEFSSTNEETISLFVPMEIKKRGGSAMIIVPKDTGSCHDEDDEAHPDETLINAFAKAYKWQMWLKKGKLKSINDICEKEKITIKYASRIYRLNRVAPEIIEAILDGKQPRTLCLQDFMRKTIPVLWAEQLEVFGFESTQSVTGKATSKKYALKRSFKMKKSVQDSEEFAFHHHLPMSSNQPNEGRKSCL